LSTKGFKLEAFSTTPSPKISSDQYPQKEDINKWEGGLAMMLNCHAKGNPSGK